MQEAVERVKKERAESGLETPEDTLYQYIHAPETSKMPVRISVTIPRATLDEIDNKARDAGMTRSGYLAAAALATNI